MPPPKRGSYRSSGAASACTAARDLRSTSAAVGSSVTGLAVGDRVFSYSFTNPHGGCYAEYVSVIEERVGPAPQGFDLSLAGAIPTTGRSEGSHAL
ncbi:hypothetical protein ACSRUE_36530 [Sorangium sp. KYC3313]|uniref:hypothetical protein n=1 Tax=Sorangium sp. KYC3313 TaxID=3449740 RepID=UPI003F8CE575